VFVAGQRRCDDPINIEGKKMRTYKIFTATDNFPVRTRSETIILMEVRGAA
jgi:hypothetical protein